MPSFFIISLTTPPTQKTTSSSDVPPPTVPLPVQPPLSMSVPFAPLLVSCSGTRAITPETKHLVVFLSLSKTTLVTVSVISYPFGFLGLLVVNLALPVRDSFAAFCIASSALAAALPVLAALNRLSLPSELSISTKIGICASVPLQWRLLAMTPVETPVCRSAPYIVDRG